MVTENTAPNAAADVEMSQYVADRTRVNEDKIKKDDEIISQFGDYNYGWHDSDAAGEAAKRGIDENVVRAISADKGEPQWMLDMRLRGFKAFLESPCPIGVWISPASTQTTSSTTSSQSTSRRKAGTNCLTTSATPTIVSASRRRRRTASSPAWPPSTSRRSSTTPSRRT